MSFGDALSATLMYALAITALHARLSLFVIAYKAHKYKPSQREIDLFCDELDVLRKWLYGTQLDKSLNDYIASAKHSRHNTSFNAVLLSLIIVSLFGFLSIIILYSGVSSSETPLTIVGLVWLLFLMLTLVIGWNAGKALLK